MATVSTTRLSAAVYEAIRKLFRFRNLNDSRPDGVFLLKWTKTLTAAETADFDASGDILELFKFPKNTRLIKASVTVPDMDEDASPAITLDLKYDSTVLTADSTSGQAGGDVTYDSAGAPVDVSETTLKLVIDTVAATVPSSYSSGFTAYALVYHGAPVTV